MTGSQVGPHHADRVELPGRDGPLAALRRPVPDAPIALLVPGYTGSKEDFTPLLDPIADAGVEPVAIDLPGQYESAGPKELDAYLPAPLGTLVAEIVEKLAADGRPILLLGHSYGGLVARAAVLSGAPVRGLTLLSSGPGELPTGPRRKMLDLAEPVLRDHGVEALANLRRALYENDPVWRKLPVELRTFLDDRFRRSSAECLLGMAVGLRTEPDLADSLARHLETTGTPCLVACGAEDDAWPVAAQRDMADRLDADFATIPGARHSPAVENPAALLGVLLSTWRMWLA
ncbi:alpha/beta fold hydrolase [Kibdelosporangium phytohabitans]|uniref:Alpha/beta hydrolase n=1 Tax=Kibdelosporangium phytohabitans TaxID=860235 RepID=A0A0N9HX09_9PSEU|nr:alpha/beta hydrolase [Kibdelosporangium phytohabitans]ALG06716.1 alpha/beta hydrolase [Kibdelosporangium phytohabitans]MBE1467938.1 pimeloyl-ACP methyl ester carboxylesterase [Kibdelosporangium phytohabitans]